MSQFLVGLAILIIVFNLYYFFNNKAYKKSYFSTVLFMKLFFVLTGVMIGFALLYYALALQDVVLVQTITDKQPIDHSFWNLLYYSGVTLLSVGYGDMLPVGAARFFSLLEAAIGVLLPTAYFIKAIDHSKKDN
ncbi:potassium channel family protein [Paraliobacillus sp. X-1268]|uniref:potassium channel family protein n=1 Tax=Paraliobacillus sp. X-1268 TaxID=2213193 RepID=UPI000E3D022B|nr:potassium channel family protein [Paraliobacillus sp. X-1268]